MYYVARASCPRVVYSRHRSVLRSNKQFAQANGLKNFSLARIAELVEYDRYSRRTARSWASCPCHGKVTQRECLKLICDIASTTNGLWLRSDVLAVARWRQDLTCARRFAQQRHWRE